MTGGVVLGGHWWRWLISLIVIGWRGCRHITNMFSSAPQIVAENIAQSDSPASRHRLKLEFGIGLRLHQIINYIWSYICFWINSNKQQQIMICLISSFYLCTTHLHISATDWDWTVSKQHTIHVPVHQLASLHRFACLPQASCIIYI